MVFFIGSLTGLFKRENVLRQQGDPCSLYFVVLGMEVFSRMLDEAAEREKVGHHPKCRKIGLTYALLRFYWLLQTAH